MADQKISQLAAVTDVLAADEYVVARAGATKKITGTNLKGAILYGTRSSNTILGTADKGKTLDLTASFTQTFTAAATLGAGWWVILRAVHNSALPVVTLDPNGAELINGISTLRLCAGATVLVTCDGSAFQTQTLAGVVSPADVDDLIGWWDAADASTITDAGAGAVSAWADKSGLGHTLTEATNRPTTGTRTLNGLNVLDFDGTNDQLRKTSGVKMSAGAGYIVVEPDSVTGTQVILKGQANTLTINTIGADAKFSISQDAAQDTIAGAMVIGTPVLMRVRSLGGLGRNSRVGATETDGSNENATQRASTEINVSTNAGGGTLFFNGKIAEILVAERADPITDLALRNYLANKWGVTA